MYVPTAILALGFLATAHAAIDASVLTQIPTCAQAPLLSGIAGSGCEVTDVDCICADKSLLATLQSTVMADCSAADQEKTLQITANICPGLGSSSAATATTAATATSTTSSADVAASTDAAASTTGILTDTAPITASTYVSWGTGTSMINYTATTGTFTAPASPTVAPSTGNAAPGFQLGWMVAGMGAMGLGFVGL